MSLKKKLLITVIAIAGLAPLAGCYSPGYNRYGYYDSYGYYHNGRVVPGYDRYGYRDYRDSDRDTRTGATYEGVRPGDPYYDNYTPRY